MSLVRLALLVVPRPKSRRFSPWRVSPVLPRRLPSVKRRRGLTPCCAAPQVNGGKGEPFPAFFLVARRLQLAAPFDSLLYLPVPSRTRTLSFAKARVSKIRLLQRVVLPRSQTQVARSLSRRRAALVTACRRSLERSPACPSLPACGEVAVPLPDLELSTRPFGDDATPPGVQGRPNHAQFHCRLVRLALLDRPARRAAPERPIAADLPSRPGDSVLARRRAVQLSQRAR